MKAILFLKRDQRCCNPCFNFTKNITYTKVLNLIFPKTWFLEEGSLKTIRSNPSSQSFLTISVLTNLLPVNPSRIEDYTTHPKILIAIIVYSALNFLLIIITMSTRRAGVKSSITSLFVMARLFK